MDGISVKTTKKEKSKNNKNNKKPRKKPRKAVKNVETKVNISVTPPNDAVVMFDRKSDIGGLKKMENEKWMDCYVAFE